MKLAIFLAAFAAAFIVPSSGLSCLECAGASTEQECNAIGRIRVCRWNQDACHIEFRRHEGWGGALKIYKQCKQSRACTNNYVQNPRAAWSPSQCNPDNINSVCRCCCYDDMCNVAMDQCLGRPGCGQQPDYINRGQISCTNGGEHGSVCTVSCNSNSKLVGTATTYCRYDGMWSHPLARCADIFCPQRISIVNGWFICTNSIFSGSQCSARCRPGYRLVGSLTSTCLPSGFWDRREPRCEPLQCPPRGTIFGGSVNCTDGDNLQSRCESTCIGFRRLEGIVHSYCQDNGEWSHPLPTCELIQCPIRAGIVHGSVSCSLGVEVTSFCTAICDEGYQADGITESECLATGFWSEPLPRCERIQCPDRGSVIDGQVTCSDSAFTGSTCSVVCDPGTMLVGIADSECLPTGAWTTPLPECQRIICPERGTILNGVVSCTNKRYEGSVCTASCNTGTELIGTSLSTCIGPGVWSDPLPSCGRVMCPALDFSGQPGFMACTDENYYNSDCSFTCEIGFRLQGSPRLRCQRNGLWTSRMPACVPVRCPNRGRVINGDVSCTDGVELDSFCTASCDPGFEMIGEEFSVCETPGVWSLPLPRCVSVRCPNRGRVINGDVTCTDGVELASSCTASCDPGFELVGENFSVCLRPGVWSVPLPTCQRGSCPAQGVLEHGSISCTRNWAVSSVCTFECLDEGYQLHPPGRVRNLCEPSSRWNLPKPCCSRPCPPYAVMDIVLVLDSSSSIGDENWISLTAFVRSIIRSFIVAEDAANFAIFRFNRDIDTTTQILLNDYPGDVEALVAAFDLIPYDGSGTFTGQGLQHALDTSLAPGNGNRPDVKDVVLVITDGKAADDVKTPADDLRAAGATILVLGIEPPRGRLDEGQLEDIAGGTANLVIARDGFGGLGTDFALTLSRTICGEPCS